MDTLAYLLSKLGIKKAEVASSEEDTEARPEQLLDELTLDGVAQYIKSGKCKLCLISINLKWYCIKVLMKRNFLLS